VLRKSWTLPWLVAAALVVGAAPVGALAASAPPPSPPLLAPSAYRGAAHLKKFEETAKAHPTNLVDNFEAGVSAFQNGQPKIAIKYYLQCLKINRSFGEGANDIGNVYRESLGNNAKAIQYYTEATKSDPSYVFSWINLGLVYEAEHKNPQAIADFTAATRYAPSFDEGWAYLVGLDAQLGDLGAAKTYAQRALKALPKNDPQVPYFKSILKKK